VGILIENEFEVPAPADAVWRYVLDVERIAPCMPGAHLTEVIDEDHFKGKLTVKLGPVSLSFAGSVTVLVRDEEERRVELKATGMEQRGKGSATALITAWVQDAGGGTTVRFKQDITVSGAVAQFSRGMMQDVSGKLTKTFADCLKTNITAEEEFRASEAAADEAETAAENAPAEKGSAENGPTENGPVKEASPATATSTPDVPTAAPAAKSGPPPPRPPATRPPLATAKSIGGIRLGLWAFWRAIVRFFSRLLGRRPAG
jgi:uncharacterized protein